MVTLWTAATIVGYLVSLVVIRWVLLSKNRQAVSTVAWMMAIVMLPFVGALLFVIFGINRVERRAQRKQQAARAIGRALPTLSQYNVIPGELQDPLHANLMRLSMRVGDTLPTVGNEIEVLADTNRTLGLIEQAVLSAKESLHFEYYIWQPDRAGTRLRDLLIQKANEGVKVRFLYDTIGSSRLGKKFMRPMIEAGISVAPFLPGATFRERWSINLRNHRKIAIIDGRVGFTGGMNIGDEYLGRLPQWGFWRDTHLKIRGPTVLQLQQVFAEDWYYATNEELVSPRLYPPPEQHGAITAHAVSGEPAGDVFSLHSLFFTAITEARERLTIATSYFVPSYPLVTALESAAQRGVRVRLLVPGKASYWWTVMAGQSFYEPLLAAGVEIYEYMQGSMHAKTMTVDGTWSLVGTPNFDARSLLLNFEVAIAMYDSKIASQLEGHFAVDLEKAKRIELDEWMKRSSWRVLGENCCRLFAPIL